MPTKGAFYFVSLLVEFLIEPTEQARNGNGLLCVSPIRVDDRNHFLSLYQVLVVLRVKARIQRECRTMKLNANLGGKGNQLGQALRQNHRILSIDRFDSEWSQNEPVVVYYSEFFVSFLVFVS